MLDPVALLERAVSIPSVSGQEADVADYLATQMATFADSAFVDEAGNAVGVVGHGAINITCLGHIDTVPGHVPVVIQDGKLYGRGSVDAKGSFCTAVAAASRLPENVRERLTVRLIGAVEEEAPSSKGARFAVTAYPKPDMLIIGEPSGWDALTLGYKGRLVVKLEHAKPNFHSAGDDTTATEDVVNAWNAVQKLVNDVNDGVTGIFDKVQISLANVNSSSDGMTQRCEAALGLRLPPAHAPEEMVDMLEPLLTPFSVTMAGHERAHRAAKDTPLSRAFRVAIRQHGGSPRFKVKTGTSDMNVVAPSWDVPMLAYGPGDSSLDHTPQEHLDVAELEQAVTVLSQVFQRLGT